MMCNQERMERLYLSKGDQDIYIDNCKIPQHHIDGIRFIYSQYKKNKSGVIVNYRTEYARNLHIVLFLKAIHRLLKKPVLILCKEGAEHNWMEQFQTWTDFYDEVVLETQKPFIKKLVLINTMSNLSTFSKHEWSVMIVDDNDDDISHQVLKLHFKADYKIYTTSVNMKENLDTFTQIYKWLRPEEAKDKNKWKFDKNNFISNSHNVRDIIDKAILLDAFMQDIVAINYTTDFCNQELKSIGQETDNSPPIKVSRKNKDATGTKIKRSRRIIEDDDEDDDIPLSKAKADRSLAKEFSKAKGDESLAKECSKIEGQNLAKENSTIETDASTTENSNKVVGDTDIANECNKYKKDLEEKCNEVNNLTVVRDSKVENKSNSEKSDVNEDFNIDNSKSKRINKKDVLTQHLEHENMKTDDSNESQTKLYYEPDSATDNSDKFHEMDTLVFSDQLCGDQGSNIDEPIHKASNLDRDDENSTEFNEISNKLNTNDIEVDNIRKLHEVGLKSPSHNEQTNDQKSDEFENDKDCTNDDIKSTDSQSIFTDFNIDNNEIDLITNTTSYNEMNSDIDEKIKEKSCNINEEIANNINIKSTLDDKQTELEQNGFIDSTKTITNNIDRPIVNVLKRNLIDDEMKEMEEKALKKFKGSILDRLF